MAPDVTAVTWSWANVTPTSRLSGGRTTGLPSNETEDAVPMSSNHNEDVWLYVPGKVFNRPMHAILLATVIVLAATP